MRSAFLLLGSTILPFAIAFPAKEPSVENALEERATVKLNQYRTFADCSRDKDILYHAAPVSGRCYNLDDKTGAYFLNTGGYLYCKSYSNKDCTGQTRGYEPQSGNCYDKGIYRSVKCS